MLRAALLAFALLAAPAFADPPEGELTAAPGSIATGMIEQADANGVFDIVHNGQVSVRHTASGLRCDFERDGAGGRLALFPGLPRGDDVACDFDYDNFDVTLYASRYPGPPPLDGLLAGSAQAIRHVYPDARAVEPAYDVDTQGMPPHRAARFLLTKDGIRYFSSVHIAQVGEWTIKQRYSAPAETADAARQADLAASLMFQATLSELVTPPNL
ncbi:hypothetical protein [Terricaulis sp.]|uniref:hypothetical protein n=1 Tax=Terricaulis sp. TaxID=2768686 RepID=UPI002AC4D2D4|nr:hypothetical protein [Terricaulis sp.]MDZ4690074.1 hypothetical protein [Terricaulis sp.]